MRDSSVKTTSFHSAAHILLSSHHWQQRRLWFCVNGRPSNGRLTDSPLCCKRRRMVAAQTLNDALQTQCAVLRPIVRVHYFVRGGFVGHLSCKFKASLPSSSGRRARFLGGQKGVALQDQARHRFVEWDQNEIAVVPDFHKRILFSDEAHFWLNGYVNKQNYRIWREANPQVYVETPLHPEKLTVWCALWAGGILLQKQ
ncbi:uncharacterized protein TNCV_5071011 [Trichonephila clavipes]|nr:uncharacterized protein TNCV_5071011 [Trichonephila clavipes]